MQKFVLGIDIGGTNIRFGLINRQGHLISKTSLSTKSFIRHKNKLITSLVLEIRKITEEKKLRKSQILGIGIGLPGLVNTPKGLVYLLTNIPGWKNVPLKKIIEKRLRIPTFIDNDVNLMALGEWRYGAGDGLKDIVCITLGTGIGGGLIINHRLYRGEGFSAGELGHIPINEKGPMCNCGGVACLERYIGNKTLLSKARRLFKKKDISLEDITSMASKGNKKALEFWNEVGVKLGVGLSGVVNLLNPQRIVIGGGVSGAHRFFFSSVRKTLKQRAMKIPAQMVEIVKAKLGNDAGIIGARVLVENNLRNK